MKKGDVQKKIEKVFKTLDEKRLIGKRFSLSGVMGDYVKNWRNRKIKEVLFYNMGDASRDGATWKLTYPKEKKQYSKMADRVMKVGDVTHYYRS